MSMLARKSNGISLCELPPEHTAFLAILREETEAQTPPFTVQLNLLTGTRSPQALLVVSGYLSLPEEVSGLQQDQCYNSQQTNETTMLCVSFSRGDAFYSTGQLASHAVSFC